mgnify:CR=1 FL=1
MYQDSNMLASIRKVEAAREENAKLDPRRMTAEEKDTLLKKFHPDYRAEQFTELRFGPNKGQKVPLELAELLEGESRILHEQFDLTKPDYETDVLIIGGGGAGCSAAVEADKAGVKVMVVTKLRMGDANTMMAEGGIQAADKPNDSPAQHFLDAYGGGHFAAQKDLLYKLVMDAPEAIQWLSGLGVEFDKAPDGTMITTHGGGTSRKRMHAAKDYSGAEIMRTLRDEVLNRGIPVVDFTSAVELIKDENGHCATPRAHSQPSARDGMPTRIISLTYWATMEGLPTPMDTSTPISRRRSFIHSSSTRHSTRAAKMSTPIRVPRIMERTP